MIWLRFRALCAVIAASVVYFAVDHIAGLSMMVGIAAGVEIELWAMRGRDDR